ncbi:GNAT family N-acetyltransferase [Paenibacillus eucommiae]|uniref:GNAT superfamily N-acetyltransferase n=1 Tax=Paenibacillus eucommiae TaxID=1355755 RepID=A0ABS4ISL7_9BACL|nr:GNAT family N-acetyltransferase [Paenibacillus eucommiae]MBP1989876.1 GNAT superfamily N-acetyltransferase [Paenibacillus eucommiae]
MSYEKLGNEFVQISNYRDNESCRDSFNRLASLVYGIDFEEWHQKGFWDDTYICHSILSNNEVVSNISVSKMTLTINGLNRKAIQIGTVMTHPDFRGRGLSGILMLQVLETYKHDCDLFFLFANSSVLDYYPKFGFTAISESQFKLHIDPIANLGISLRKLDPSKAADLEFIKRMVLSRKPISERFGVGNNQGIFMFYVLNVFPQSLYYSPEDEAIIVFQQEGQTLHVYDVVSQNIVNWDGLLPRLANEQTQTVHFHFTPEQFTSNAEFQPVDGNEDVLFVQSKETLNLHSAFCAPITAHA